MDNLSPTALAHAVPANFLARLEASLREALDVGARSAAQGLSTNSAPRWLRTMVSRLEIEAPEYFIEGSRYRSPAIATLQAAFHMGHQAWEEESAGILQRTPEWYEDTIDMLISGFCLSIVVEGLLPVDEKEYLDPPELQAAPVYSVITDEGVQRVASDWMRDEEGQMYQLIVVRAHGETTLYRRRMEGKAVDPVPLTALSDQELNFLSLAFAELRDARTRNSLPWLNFASNPPREERSG